MKQKAKEITITDPKSLDALTYALKKEICEMEETIADIRKSVMRKEELIMEIKANGKYTYWSKSDIK